MNISSKLNTQRSRSKGPQKRIQNRQKCNSDSDREEEPEDTIDGIHYEACGYYGKKMLLYHVTDPDAARAIASSNKMLRGRSGMYGGGIYFAESISQATDKAKHAGAHVVATVEVGRSAIFKNSMYKLSYRKLKNKGFDSAVGAHGSNLEYVIYNWSQVDVEEIYIGSTKVFTKVIQEVNNSNQSTMYHNLVKCTRQGCKYYGTFHTNNHEVNCTTANCIYNGTCHEGEPHKLKCAAGDCALFGTYHVTGHIFNCKIVSCMDYRTCHEGQPHRHKCVTQGCMNYGIYHQTNHLFVCNQQNCEEFGRFHAGNHINSRVHASCDCGGILTETRYIGTKAVIIGIILCIFFPCLFLLPLIVKKCQDKRLGCLNSTCHLNRVVR